MSEDPEYLTVVEAAALLRTPVATMYRWRTQGEGPPAAKVGRRLLYRRAELTSWVAAQVA